VPDSSGLLGGQVEPLVSFLTVKWCLCAYVPDRKYKIRGRSAFAFSDVRRIIAEAALDQDFQSICPVPQQRPKKSFVKTLLRVIA
jgi:hypothetical protein